MTTGVSVRNLASPGFVLALVVLIVNDHFLKQAWPGFVTGKLSDVAGLVVAPLLLGVLLTAWRMPRPLPVAIALTGLGFTVVKASAAGAALASTVWSLTGIPTQMRADVTDLFALPALYGAWLVHRQTLTIASPGWRRSVAVATGTALLPVAVLATAATNCVPHQGVQGVWDVYGSYAGPPSGTEHRVVVHSDTDTSGWLTIDSSGRVAKMPAADRDRLPRLGDWRTMTSSACDDAGTCWRIPPVEQPTTDEQPTVEISHDLGKTWTTDFAMSEEEAEDAVDGVHTGCGDAGARLGNLVVLDHGRLVQVAVTASHAGVLTRSTAGVWSRIPLDALEEPATPSEPRRHPTRTLYLRQPTLPPTESPSPSWSPHGSPDVPSLPPDPTCASPTTVTVTPNPQNGPPTTNTFCP